jgi:RNA polymerase sigma-70 factor (ECF subfamily)
MKLRFLQRVTHLQNFIVNQYTEVQFRENDMLEAISSEIISRAQEGDSTVLSDLYEHYRASIFRFLYYRVGEIQAAEDLTSEVFLRMIRSIGGYRPRGIAFEAWLFQIARNLAIDYYRKQHRDQSVPLQEEILSTNEGVEKMIDGNLNNENLVQALSHLNEAQRDVIVLRFVNEMPIAQVAQTLHKSEDSVKALQRRGLIALREILSRWEVQYGSH